MCHQPLGKRWFYNYPALIAEYLGLPNPKRFTGHTICGTGATIVADSGATKLQLKKYGCWKSDRVAEHYYKRSLTGGLQNASRISGMFGLNNHQNRSTINPQSCSNDPIQPTQLAEDVEVDDQEMVDVDHSHIDSLDRFAFGRTGGNGSRPESSQSAMGGNSNNPSSSASSGRGGVPVFHNCTFTGNFQFSQ